MPETKLSLAADVGWLRLTILWAEQQPMANAGLLGGVEVVRELELARTRLIARLKDQERFKTGLMEKMK